MSKGDVTKLNTEIPEEDILSGDIPAHHKKVSERYREEATDLKRAFSDMQEITDMIEKRGARGNRGDMKALKAWLVKYGLSEAFGKILI
ncbi:hypothetical protein H9Q74_002769 [Fusarium xylarioides]|nr:hypothetical protein H9Q74_002769 [Fusarium xylarioides]